MERIIRKLQVSVEPWASETKGQYLIKLNARVNDENVYAERICEEQDDLVCMFDWMVAALRNAIKNKEDFDELYVSGVREPS